MGIYIPLHALKRSGGRRHRSVKKRAEGFEEKGVGGGCSSKSGGVSGENVDYLLFN